MGSVYSVYLKIEYSDEKKIIEKMKKFIDDKKDEVVFNLDYYSEKYDLNTVDGLIKVFITDRGFTKLSDNEYSSSFDATYGWDIVILDMIMDVFDDDGDAASLNIHVDDDSKEVSIEKSKINNDHEELVDELSEALESGEVSLDTKF